MNGNVLVGCRGLERIKNRHIIYNKAVHFTLYLKLLRQNIKIQDTFRRFGVYSPLWEQSHHQRE